MRAWLWLLVCATVVVAGTGKSKEDSQSPWRAEEGPLSLAAGTKALAHAYKEVCEENELPQHLRTKDAGDQQDMMHGLARALAVLPRLREAVLGHRHVRTSAATDAARVAHIKHRNQAARTAALRERGGAAGAVPVLLSDETPNICHHGTTTERTSLLNTCLEARVCRVAAFTTGGNETLSTEAGAFLNNTSVDVTQLVCSGLPVDLVGEHGASGCHVQALGCSPSTALHDCDVEVVCDTPTHLAFGLGDGRFAYRCSTDTLVCNGTAVDDPAAFDSKPLPAECAVASVPCNASRTCHSISVNESGTVVVDSTLPCYLRCVRLVNASHCVCPADYTGTNCQTHRPVSCTAYLVAPLPQCTAATKDDELLVYDRPCLRYSGGLQDSALAMRWNVSCKFASVLTQYSAAATANLTNFSYWLDAPDLKLSAEPVWRVRLSAFRFDTRSSAWMTAANDTVTLTLAHLLGTEPVRLTLTPTAGFVEGGRVYAELAFDHAAAPTGMAGAVLRRFFLDDAQGGFGGGDGGRRIGAGLGTGEVAATVLGCIVGAALLLALGRYIYRHCYKPRDPQEPPRAKAKQTKKD